MHFIPLFQYVGGSRGGALRLTVKELNENKRLSKLVKTLTVTSGEQDQETYMLFHQSSTSRLNMLLINKTSIRVYHKILSKVKE